MMLVQGGALSERPTICALIETAETGDSPSAKALFAALYAELRRMARQELARRGFGVSLGVTTLLHEAYLDMAQRAGPHFRIYRVS